MSDRKQYRTANEYLQYLKGELSNQERHSIERDLETDPFEKEAMEGLEAITPGEAEEDILAMHAKLRKRMRRKRKIAFYSAAASIASLLIVGTIFLQIHDFNPEIAEKSMLDEKSFSTAAESDESGATGEGSEPVVLEEQKDAGARAETEITEVQVADAPDPEVTALEVADEVARAEAPIRETEMKYDMEVVDEKIVATDEEIVAMEAEPVPGAAKRTKSVRYKPAAEAPEQEQKMALRQEEFTHLVSGKVSGVVISGEDMGPIPGAAVSIKGTSRGVVTDMDGRFTIPVEYDSNTTIIASFVGMETQEYQVAETQDFELVMQPDAMTLDEVVIVGRGVQRRAEQTGAYTTVDLKEEEAGTDYTLAEPTGGYKAFKQYIEEHISFPSEESTVSRAIVVLRFTVSHTGNIEDIMALRSPGLAFTREAERLLLEGPSWLPASSDKGTKEDAVRVRIVFKK